MSQCLKLYQSLNIVATVCSAPQGDDFRWDCIHTEQKTAKKLRIPENRDLTRYERYKKYSPFDIETKNT